MSPLVLHEFRRGPNAVREALAAARGYCDAQGLGDCPAVALIVEELVVNLVDYGGALDDRIEMGLSRDRHAIRLTLCDGGLPFDPRIAPAPELPPDRGGGAGLAIVRAWSRIELYTRIDGRNYLQLAIPLGDLDRG